MWQWQTMVVVPACVAGGGAHLCGSVWEWWCPRVWQWKAVVVMPTCLAVAGGAVVVPTCVAVVGSAVVVVPAYVAVADSCGGAHECGSAR